MILSSGNYFGTKKLERELEHFKLTIFGYEGGQNIPFHCHENPYVSIALLGNYQEQANAKLPPILVDQQKVMIRSADYEHSNDFGKGAGVCFNVEIKNRLEGFLTENEIFSESHVTFEFARLVHATMNAYEEDELNMMCHETLSQLSHLSRISAEKALVKKVIDFVEDNYPFPNQLTEIARFVDVHPVYLARVFKQCMGTTIGEYLHQVRIREAYLQLFQPNRTLTEIAYDTGFYDQSHFTRRFKNQFHTTPKQSRAMLQRFI